MTSGFGLQKVRAIMLALAALSLGACATVTSRYGSDAIDQEGVAYYLPKGVVQVRVVEQSDQFSVIVAGPIIVADKKYRLHADLRHGAFSDDNTVVTVDPDTQLLTSTTVESTGRAETILTNLAKSFGSLQSGDGAPSGTTVFSGLYEPSEMGTASTEASAALNNYYARLCGGFGNLSDGAFNAAMKSVHLTDATVIEGQKATLTRCRKYALLGINQPGLIQLSAPDLGTNNNIGATTSNSSTEKCRRGLCHRPLVPVKIRSVIAGTYQSEDFYMLPDTSTVSSYSVPAGFFGKQQYTLEFDRGVLTKADQKTESELVGLSLMPVKILKAVISAPVDILTERQKTLEAEEKYLEAAAKRANKIEETRKVCNKSPGLCPGTAFKVMNVPLSDRPSDDDGGETTREGTPGEGNQGQAGADGGVSANTQPNAGSGNSGGQAFPTGPGGQ